MIPLFIYHTPIKIMVNERVIYIYCIGLKKAQPMYDLLDERGYGFDIDIDSDDGFYHLFVDRKLAKMM